MKKLTIDKDDKNMINSIKGSPLVHCSLFLILTLTFTACKDPTVSTDPCDSGHNWSNWVETSPASITEELVEVNGQDSRTCSVCGETQNNSVTYQSYFYGTWKIELGTDWEQLIITENTINITSSHPISNLGLLTIETWTVDSNMITETNYPYGYRIDTTNFPLFYYMHTDKLSIYSDSGAIFIKQ